MMELNWVRADGWDGMGGSYPETDQLSEYLRCKKERKGVKKCRRVNILTSYISALYHCWKTIVYVSLILSSCTRLSAKQEEVFHHSDPQDSSYLSFASLLSFFSNFLPNFSPPPPTSVQGKPRSHAACQSEVGPLTVFFHPTEVLQGARYLDCCCSPPSVLPGSSQGLLDSMEVVFLMWLTWWAS